MMGMMAPDEEMAIQADGNMQEVPPGALPSEVADDIPAKLSEGEFVMPADVVRWHGLKSLMAMRTEAKDGLAAMDAEGQIGGAQEAPGGLGGIMAPSLPEMSEAPPEAPGEFPGFAVGGLAAPKAPTVRFKSGGNNEATDANHGAGKQDYDHSRSFMDNMASIGGKIGTGIGYTTALGMAPVAGMVGLGVAGLLGKEPISPHVGVGTMERGIMSNLRDVVDSARSESTEWGGRSSMPNSVDDWGALSADELSESYANSRESDEGGGGGFGSDGTTSGGYGQDSFGGGPGNDNFSDNFGGSSQGTSGGGGGSDGNNGAGSYNEGGFVKRPC
jgi:hypothetical protein